MHKPPTPAGLSAAGRRLWDNVLDEWDLDPTEFGLLREACLVVTRIDALEKLVGDNFIVPGQKGNPAPHPAMVEARQQRMVLYRILDKLNIKEDARVAARNRPKRGPGGRIIDPGTVTPISRAR